MITDVISRVIKCDAPECDKQVSFNPQSIEEIQKLPDWIRTFRTIQNGNKTSFGYCSDVCEVKGVTTGSHNVPEPPKVQTATSDADVRRAAADAELASKANEALKAGTIQLTD